MSVQDLEGHTLIEHNPDHLVLTVGLPVRPTARITEADRVGNGRARTEKPCVACRLARTLVDGNTVNFVVARDMTDRERLLAHTAPPFTQPGW